MTFEVFSNLEGLFSKINLLYFWPNLLEIKNLRGLKKTPKVSDHLTFGVLKTPKVFFYNHGYSQIKRRFSGNGE